MSTTSVVDTWFSAEPSTGDAGPLLFCIPYAGGGASAYRGFAAALPPGLTCIPVQLPGRESRLHEPPDIDVTDLARAIAARAAGRPYALFGHSMGARLAFEAARRLRRAGAPAPTCVFASGCRPPHMDVPLTRIAHLPDDELCARIVAMGGTPPEALAIPELREMVLPAIRADFAMVEAYRFRPEPPLDMPIVVLAGAADPEADPRDMTGWSAHTTSWTRLYTFPGDHFFIQSARPELLATVTAELTTALGPGGWGEAGGPAAGGAVEPGGRRDLAEDEVYLLDARLDGLAEPCDAVGELSPEERRRVAATTDPRTAARFVGRRVLLRRTLRAFGVDIGRTEFAYGPGGKPAVLHAAGLRFSASHSGGVAVIAVGRARELGVAVRRRRPLDLDDPEVGPHLSAAERTDLAGLAEEEVADEALRLIAAKSAVLKAADAATRVDARTVSFGDRQARPWRIEAGAEAARLTGWRVHHLDLPGAVAALATGPGDWRLRFESLRPASACAPAAPASACAPAAPASACALAALASSASGPAAPASKPDGSLPAPPIPPRAAAESAYRASAASSPVGVEQRGTR